MTWREISRRAALRAVAGMAVSGPVAGFDRAQAATRPTLRFAFSDGGPPYSYAQDHDCAGLFPSLVRWVVTEGLGYGFACTPYPWPRAQSLVENGVYDGLCTYPSERRKRYAVFSPVPIFAQDWGYLVYNRANPAMADITAARSFADLRDFTFMSIIGSSWEDEVVPAEIPRYFSPDITTQFNVMFQRNFPGFVIMSVEMAMYFAHRGGYADKVGLVRARFVPGHVIPFHIGLRKTHPHAEEIVARIPDVLASAAFSDRFNGLMARYR